MTMTLHATETTKFEGFEEEPLQVRHSHLYGEVRLYAPVGDPRRWGNLPFLLTTEHGDKGPGSKPLRHVIKVSAIQHAMNHTPVIHASHLYEGLLE